MSPAPGLPPGPRAPRLAQTLGMVLAAGPFLRRARARHGDLFTIRTLLGGDTVVVGDPGFAREVFSAPAAVLHAGEANAFLAPLVGSRSVLTLDGEEHLRHRRLLLPPFHGQRLLACEALVAQATGRAVAQWPLATAFPLLASMQNLTLEVILRLTLGTRAPAAQARLARLTRAVIEPLWRPPTLVLLDQLLGRGHARQRELARRVQELDDELMPEIARRRRRLAARATATGDGAASAGDGAVLDVLLLARDEDGIGLGDREIRDELVTLLLAGHETTATGLAWTFERLLRHPGALARVREELGAGEERYLEAVLRESLRVRPVIAGVARRVARPFTLGGHALPVGTDLVVSATLLHRRRDLYPRPDEFRPERFLDRAPDGSAWIPFGGGTRRCLGASFALMEMRVVVREILARTELRAAGRRGERAVRRGIVIAPAGGGRVVLEARRGSPRRRARPAKAPRERVPQALGAAPTT